MIPFSDVVAFNLVLLAAILVPGPAFLFITRTSLVSGRRAGIAAGLGLATGASFWTLCALLGLDGLFAAFPALYVAAKIFGAFYLIYLAIGMWRDAGKAFDGTMQPPSRVGPRYLQGLLINLGNPKSMLFSASVIVLAFPNGITGAHVALVPMNQFVLEAICYVGFAGLFSLPAFRRGYLSFARAINRICGAVMALLGIRLLLSE